MADIPIFGKLVSTTTTKEIVNYDEVAGRPEVNPTGTATKALEKIKIEDIIYSLSGLDMDKLNEVLADYVKAGGGEEIVNSYQLPYNQALTLEPNSLYIIQGYDNSYNLADFIATGGTKDITSDMAVVMCGSDNNGTLDSLIVAKTGTITTSISTATLVTTITPTKSTIYLKYWQVKGLTIGGSVSGGGTYVEANPTTDATDDLEKITIGNKTYFVGTGGSGSGMTTLYRHDVYVTATLKNSNLPVYGMRIYRTLYNASKYSIDTLSGVFPYGQDFAVQGFLTDEIAGIFDNNADFRIGPRIYYVSCGATHQKIYFTEQDITYDKDKQIVTKIEASGYFYLNGYYSPNFDMEGVVIYDKITAIPLNVSSADLAQTLELLNENTTTDSGVITTAENVKPFDEKNNLAWQMLMAKAEKFREANRLLGETNGEV